VVTRARTELVRLGALLFAVTATTAAHAAGSEPPRAQLVVTRGAGAEDCPDAAALTAKTRAMTAADIMVEAVESPRDTWIGVELSRTFSGYRATISARGRRHGTRTIDDIGPRCGSLADAVAVTLVMLMDPELSAEAPPKLPAPTVVTPPSPPLARGPSPGAELGAGASFAILEHPAPVLELGAHLGSVERAGLALGGGFFFPDRVPAAGGEVKLGLAYGYLRGSLVVLQNAGTSLVFAAGPMLGSLSGEGEHYDVQKPVQRLPWLAVAGGPELRATLASWLSWSMRLMLVAPLIHQTFRIDDAGKSTTAFTTPPLGATLTFGLLAEL
jgi:hypothetical protein